MKTKEESFDWFMKKCAEAVITGIGLPRAFVDQYIQEQNERRAVENDEQSFSE